MLKKDISIFYLISILYCAYYNNFKEFKCMHFGTEPRVCLYKDSFNNNFNIFTLCCFSSSSLSFSNICFLDINKYRFPVCSFFRSISQIFFSSVNSFTDNIFQSKIKKKSYKKVSILTDRKSFLIRLVSIYLSIYLAMDISC